MTNIDRSSSLNSEFEIDLNALLHPASAFDHPRDVLNDPDLTRHEKRAILSSWASDACAVDSTPWLRKAPGSERVVTFEEIVEALKTLDEPTRPRPGGKGMRLRRRWLRSDGHGQSGLSAG